MSLFYSAKSSRIKITEEIKNDALIASTVCQDYNDFSNFCDYISDKIMESSSLHLPIRYRPKEEPDWKLYPVNISFNFETNELKFRQLPTTEN